MKSNCLAQNVEAPGFALTADYDGFVHGILCAQLNASVGQTIHALGNNDTDIVPNNTGVVPNNTAVNLNNPKITIIDSFYMGTPLGIEGISTAAMTYVIATELVSLLENLNLLFSG